MSPTDDPDQSLLWCRIGRQTVWGKRGLAKTGTLWLPLAVVLAAGPADDLSGAWLVCVVLFAASACRTVGTILANDLADRDDDAAAAKVRWIQRLSPAAGRGIVLALLALGVAMLVACGTNVGALAAYLAAMALGLLYSLPPVRLKGRGLVGVAAYALCCACAYAVLPWAWFGSGWRVLALLGPVVFCDRWVNLHFHQVLDREADAARGCRTLAVRAGPEVARRTLRPAAHLAAVAVLALMAFLALSVRPAGPIGAVVTAAAALAVGAYASAARVRPEAGSPLLRELPGHYLGLAFGAFWALPPVLLALCALAEPTMWVPTAGASFSSLLTVVNTVRYRHD